MHIPRKTWQACVRGVVPFRLPGVRASHLPYLRPVCLNIDAYQNHLRRFVNGTDFMQNPAGYIVMGQSGLNLMTSIFLKGISVCCHRLTKDHELPHLQVPGTLCMSLIRREIMCTTRWQIKSKTAPATALGQGGCVLSPGHARWCFHRR